MQPFTKNFSLGILALPVLFLALSLTSLPHSFFSPQTTGSLFMTAAAADDENENEYDDGGSAAKTKTIQVIKNVVVYKPVTTTIVVTPDDYTKDTDSDGLVDATDPDPLVPQSQYFTDDDGDSTPNAIDRYPGEDDFAYYEFETDTNGNGILDSYEQ